MPAQVWKLSRRCCGSIALVAVLMAAVVTVTPSPAGAATESSTVPVGSWVDSVTFSYAGETVIAYPRSDGNIWLLVTSNRAKASWGLGDGIGSDSSRCHLTGETVRFQDGTGSTLGPTPSDVVTTPGNPIVYAQVRAVCPGYTGIAATPDGQGFMVVGADGGLNTFGDAPYYGSMGGQSLDQPIVGVAPSENAQGQEDGYWMDAADGGVFAFGGAGYYGSMGGMPLNQPIVGMAPTPDGKGYWLVAADGGIFAFGDAQFYGSMGGKPLNQPIVGMAADRATGGYWLVAADGGVFSFHAPFYGSTGSIALNQPIVGMAAAPDGSGYRFVASDGGVFCFDLPYLGSLPDAGVATDTVDSMAASGATGYWVLQVTGTYSGYGSAAGVW